MPQNRLGEEATDIVREKIRGQQKELFIDEKPGEAEEEAGYED